jgi:hypothetical protein
VAVDTKFVGKWDLIVVVRGAAPDQQRSTASLLNIRYRLREEILLSLLKRRERPRVIREDVPFLKPLAHPRQDVGRQRWEGPSVDRGPQVGTQSLGGVPRASPSLIAALAPAPARPLRGTGLRTGQARLAREERQATTWCVGVDWTHLTLDIVPEPPAACDDVTLDVSHRVKSAESPGELHEQRDYGVAPAVVLKRPSIEIECEGGRSLSPRRTILVALVRERTEPPKHGGRDWKKSQSP